MSQEIINSLAVIVPGIAFMFAFYKQASGAKRELVSDIKRELLGEISDRKDSKLPQPVHAVLDEKIMTVPMHDAACGPLHARVGVLECDVRAIRHKMETDKHEIIQAGEERVAHLHRRIDGLKDDIAAQPAQIVALLKNTKELIE